MIVAMANAWMISKAVSNPSVPASEDHWADNLAINEELEEREASAALGWRVRLDPCAAGDVVSTTCVARLSVDDHLLRATREF